MAATVKIIRFTGSGAGAESDITSINTRANAYDGHSTGDTSYPIQIPAAGNNYSYWVSTRLKCTVTPTGTINNVKWYTDGFNSFGTGVTCVGAKASTGANAGYRQATGSAGATGTELTMVNHTGLDESPSDVFAFTSGSPKSLIGSITNPSTGVFGDFMVYQIIVASTASPGTTGSETFTWRYDET